MTDVGKSCVICGGEESDGELLVEAPCGTHFVCPDDVASFFERATENESLFPPKCCGQMFMLQQYEDYVPFDVQWAFQVKEQGEYATLAKFRVYCGAPSCNKFLHPSTHITDSESKLTYAICEDGACGELTCTGCKMMLDQGVQNHFCKKNEEEEKFRQTAKEKGYQQCTVCGATVELMEACNHISCSCGNDFCYICGKDWPGLHGCPHYGPATHDEEGYNQEGYHRDTGLNREGLTRRQEIMRRRGLDGEDDDENEEDDGEEDPDWEVLQHLQPDQRVMINTLRGDDREDALDQLRIELFEQQGILFGQDPPPAPPQFQGDEETHEETEEDVEGVIQEEALENIEEEINEDLNEELNEGNGLVDLFPDIEPPQIEATQEHAADDQAAGGVGGLIDAAKASSFVENMHAGLGGSGQLGWNDLAWTFEGMARSQRSDDGESNTPDLGPLPQFLTAQQGETGGYTEPTSPPSFNSFLAATQRSDVLGAPPSTSNASNAGSDSRARLAQDFGVPRPERASNSPPSGPATAGPTTPTDFGAHDAMDVDEPTAKALPSAPGAWPQNDD